MVVIRLARGGVKQKPFYHIHVADQRFSRDGRFIERVGYFNPVARGKSERLMVHLERVDFWLQRGAQMSKRVSGLVREMRNPERATERYQHQQQKLEAARKVREDHKRAEIAGIETAAEAEERLESAAASTVHVSLGASEPTADASSASAVIPEESSAAAEPSEVDAATEGVDEAPAEGEQSAG